MGLGQVVGWILFILAIIALIGIFSDSFGTLFDRTDGIFSTFKPPELQFDDKGQMGLNVKLFVVKDLGGCVEDKKATPSTLVCSESDKPQFIITTENTGSKKRAVHTKLKAYSCKENFDKCETFVADWGMENNCLIPQSTTGALTTDCFAKLDFKNMGITPGYYMVYPGIECEISPDGCVIPGQSAPVSVYNGNLNWKIQVP